MRLGGASSAPRGPPARRRGRARGRTCPRTRVASMRRRGDRVGRLPARSRRRPPAGRRAARRGTSCVGAPRAGRRARRRRTCACSRSSSRRSVRRRRRRPCRPPRRRGRPARVCGFAPFGPEATMIGNASASAPSSCRSCSIGQARSRSVRPTNGCCGEALVRAVGDRRGAPDRVELARAPSPRAGLERGRVVGTSSSPPAPQRLPRRVRDVVGLEQDPAGQLLRRAPRRGARSTSTNSAPSEAPSLLGVAEVGEDARRARARRAAAAFELAKPVR